MKIKEEFSAPTNAVGTSSSTPGTGAIDTFDPIIQHVRRKKLQRFKDFLNDQRRSK